jgi:hypothetical protein
MHGLVGRARLGRVGAPQFGQYLIGPRKAGGGSDEQLDADPVHVLNFETEHFGFPGPDEEFAARREFAELGRRAADDRPGGAVQPFPK